LHAVEENVLSGLIGSELLALEQDLKCFPNERGGGEGAVDRVKAVRESCINGLVDVNHWVSLSVS
jgi:hypothetical protein